MPEEGKTFGSLSPFYTDVLQRSRKCYYLSIPEGFALSWPETWSIFKLGVSTLNHSVFCEPSLHLSFLSQATPRGRLSDAEALTGLWKVLAFCFRMIYFTGRRVIFQKKMFSWIAFIKAGSELQNYKKTTCVTGLCICELLQSKF